jgi:hypothetical protein
MNRITTLLAAGALAVGLAGTGLAVANAVTTTTTFHGCIEGTSQTLEKVRETSFTTCPKGSVGPIQWNQTGPQGPAGPSTAGAAGLDVTEASGAIAADTSSTHVACPSSHPYLLSGGSDDLAASVPQIPTEHLTDQTGTAYANGITFSLGGDTAANSLLVWVLCAK